jgi:hypothetical protein
MERLQAGGGLDAVATAYRTAAADARMLTPMMLRWRYRRLRRQAPHDSTRLAQLRAIGEELAARGLEPPA